MGWLNAEMMPRAGSVTGDFAMLMKSLLTSGMECMSGKEKGNIIRNARKHPIKVLREFNKRIKAAGLGKGIPTSVILTQMADRILCSTGNPILAGVGRTLSNLATLNGVIQVVYDYMAIPKDCIDLDKEMLGPVCPVVLECTEFSADSLNSVSPDEREYLLRAADEHLEIDIPVGDKTHTVKAVFTNVTSYGRTKSGDDVVINGNSLPGMTDNTCVICFEVDSAYPLIFTMTNMGPFAQQLAMPEPYTSGNFNTGGFTPVMQEGRPLFFRVLYRTGEKCPVDGHMVNAIAMGIARHYMELSENTFRFNPSTGAIRKVPRSMPEYVDILPDIQDRYGKYSKVLSTRSHYGVCIVGIPGAGKSAFMHRVSNMMPDVMTVELDPTMLGSTAAIENFYNYLKLMKSAIILCDDLDGWIRNDKDENTSKWIYFFDKLNYLHEHDGVSYLFMCTMNDPSIVNSTLIRRSGRIDSIIEMDAPDRDSVLKLMTFFDKKINGGDGTDFSDVLYAGCIADIVQNGFSPADIQSIFTNIRIDCEFDGKYTPDMIQGGIKCIIDRNRLSRGTYMDDFASSDSHTKATASGNTDTRLTPLTIRMGEDAKKNLLNTMDNLVDNG